MGTRLMKGLSLKRLLGYPQRQEQICSSSSFSTPPHIFTVYSASTVPNSTFAHSFALFTVDGLKADHSGGSKSKFAPSSFPTHSLSTVPNSVSTVSNSRFAPSFAPSIVDGLTPRSSADICCKSRAFSSTVYFSDLDEKDDMGGKSGDEFKGPRKNKEHQFRGVYRAIICGKVGRVPVQKILSNGHTVTVFTVGTGGMFDQRIVDDNLPMPAQWHRIAVHNEELGAYAVQKLVKNAAVYVEGDIETRVYNDRINDQVKNIPEICLRRDGKIRLLQSGESDVSKSLDELREGLF